MIARFLRWLYPPDDPLINDLIWTLGVVKYREGMERPDYNIISKVGQKKWTEVLVAQRRLYKPLEGLKVLRWDRQDREDRA